MLRIDYLPTNLFDDDERVEEPTRKRRHDKDAKDAKDAEGREADIEEGDKQHRDKAGQG